MEGRRANEGWRGRRINAVGELSTISGAGGDDHIERDIFTV